MIRKNSERKPIDGLSGGRAHAVQNCEPEACQSLTVLKHTEEFRGQGDTLKPELTLSFDGVQGIATAHRTILHQFDTFDDCESLGLAIRQLATDPRFMEIEQDIQNVPAVPPALAVGVAMTEFIHAEMDVPLILKPIAE